MTDVFVAPKQDKPHINILSSFSQNPKNISFEGQKEKESIVLFLRSHFITNLSWILITIILIILPIIILTFISNLGLAFFSTPISSHFTTIFTLLYYLLVFSYVFTSFLHWFYNVFIITSQRIVEIDYSDIVIHDTAAASLNHIQEIDYAQSGFVPTFLNYGNLFVRTVGDEKNFEVFSIPKPKETVHVLKNLTGIK
jgi:hypothetical protein